jgi:hypothetical protein
LHFGTATREEDRAVFIGYFPIIIFGIRLARNGSMSWDVNIYRFPSDIENVAQLSDDFKLAALAPRTQVAESLKQLFPEADISDLSWLVVDREGFKIEISTGHAEPCLGLTLHVRGEKCPLAEVTQIAEHFAARAFDMTAYQFLDRMPDPASGFNQWQKYIHRTSRRSASLVSN